MSSFISTDANATTVGADTSTNKSKQLINIIKTLEARDDAVSVGLVDIEDILSGRVLMAFTHVQFLLDMFKYFEELNTLALRAELVLQCSIYRNVMIINGVNDIFHKINTTRITKNLILKKVTPEMEHIYNNLDLLKERGEMLNVDITGYTTHTESIDKDIEDCSNSWNQEQINSQGKAVDCVILIKDIDDTLFLLSIVRGFGPGKDNIAFPGGFVDATDRNLKESAIRELEEETGLSNLNIDKTTKISMDLPTHESHSWDPRGKFPLGMIVGGFGIFYKISSLKRVIEHS
jgi:hypothetical protein